MSGRGVPLKEEHEVPSICTGSGRRVHIAKLVSELITLIVLRIVLLLKHVHLQYQRGIIPAGALIRCTSISAGAHRLRLIARPQTPLVCLKQRRPPEPHLHVAIPLPSLEKRSRGCGLSSRSRRRRGTGGAGSSGLRGSTVPAGRVASQAL